MYCAKKCNTIYFFRCAVFVWRPKLPKLWVSSWAVSSAVGSHSSPCTSWRLSATTVFPKWHFLSFFGLATVTLPSTHSFTLLFQEISEALLRKLFVNCFAEDPRKTHRVGFSWHCTRAMYRWDLRLYHYLLYHKTLSDTLQITVDLIEMITFTEIRFGKTLRSLNLENLILFKDSLFRFHWF